MTTAAASRGLVDRLFRHAQVAELAHLTGRMLRITLTGPDVAALRPSPGQQLRINVKDLSTFGSAARNVRDGRRSYSVWRHDAARGELDLCVLEHDDPGPGARWARQLHVGDSVTFSGPEGGFVLRDSARAHVFVAEETGAVAVTAMLRDLPAAAVVRGVLECADPEDELPQDGAHRLPWVHRGEAGAASSPLLIESVRTLDVPAGAVAYVAGEARTCQAVRRVLTTDHGLGRRDVLVKPFWTPGKRGLE